MSLPEYVAQDLMDFVGTVAAQIGESPEAWRGVHEFIEGIRAVSSTIKDAMDETPERGDEFATKGFALIVSLSLGIETHPLMKLAKEHYERNL